MQRIDANKRPPAKRRRADGPRQRSVSPRAVDRKIEKAAKSTFNFRMLLGNRVVAKAADGIVTLEGFVRDGEERSLARETAESLKNVKGVRDELLLVRSGPNHSGAERVAKIYRRLATMANVDADTIWIEERGGLLSVKGVVDNSAHRALVEAIVRQIDGVSSVRNELEVDPLAIACPPEDPVDDASISGLVKSALLSAGLKADVETANGFVVLSGTAASFVERTAVESMAQSFRGVKCVMNEMTVR